MPSLKKKKHELETPKDQDIIVKVGKFRIYFQNYYTIISLVNDVLLGGLFLVGSIATLLDASKWISRWSYFLGALFMLMRPVLRILRNIFIYDKKEFQEKITDPDLLGNKSETKDLHMREQEDSNNYEENKSREEKMEKIKRNEDKD